jgi:AsmA protein
MTYDDSSATSHWRIQKLNATIGAIEPGRPVPLNLQGTIDNGTDKRSAAVTIKANLQTRSEAQAFDMDSLAIDAALTDRALPLDGLPVSLTVPHLQYSSAQAMIDVPAFVLASQTLQLSGSLIGHQLSSAPVLAGSIELKPINLRSWIGKLGIDAPATRDPLALSSVAGHVAFAMNDNGLTLKPLHFALDASQIDGELVLPKADGRPMEFQVRVDGIDVDRYLSPKSPALTLTPTPTPKAESKPTELPVSSIRALNLRGALQVKTAKAAGMKIDDLAVTVNAGDGDVALKPIQAKFYGGAYNGAASIDVRGALPKLTTDATIAGVDVGALFNALYQSRRLSGRATLTAQLSAEGPDLTAWLKSVAGRLDANLTNGALQGIDVEYAIAQAVALIGQHTLTSRPDTRQTPFTQLIVKNRFTAGAMTTENLSAETALLKITGEGNFALANTFTDYHLAASLLKRPDAKSPGGLANLAGATIPFTITGPVDKMSIRPDVEGLVKGQVKQQLQEKTKDLTKGLFDKLMNGR